MNVDELFVQHFRDAESRKRRRSAEWHQRSYKARVNHFLRLGYSKPEAIKRAGDNL